MTFPRFFLPAIVGLLFGVQSVSLARAQDYPTRPITLIAPWPAGGAIDTLCRILGPKLSDRLGKPVIIENRAGAASIIGTASVAKGAPDGYTLLMGGGTALAVAITVYKRLTYDPSKDFAPISLISRIPFVLVAHPSLSVRSVPQLIQLAKEKPGQLSYASGGPGSPHHLFMELLKSMTGIEMTHIPYKGNAPAATDVLGGHVPLMFSDPVPSLPPIREGKLLALGVSSLTRWPASPQIPPIAEAGVPGFEAVAWSMIVAPANTPNAIVNKLHSALKGILELPEIQQQLINLGMIPVSSPPPEELQRFINSEIGRWGKIVHQAGIAGSE